MILSWEKRNALRLATGEIKCNAPGCDIEGKHQYMIIENIRYCKKHGDRLKRTGFLELQPHINHNKGKKISEETRSKLLGRIPHNRIEFSEEQIVSIMSDPRSAKKVAKDLGITEKVIIRVRKTYAKK